MNYPHLINCSLKSGEDKILYDFIRDEIFKLDDEAFELIGFFTGKNNLKEIKSRFESGVDEILEFLINENLVEDLHIEDAAESFKVQQNFSPSLRYLQLNITGKCNLNCLHCYLGEKENDDIELELAKEVISQFAPFGWKILLTGGEPLLAGNLWGVLEYLKGFPLRVEMLTNGTLIDKATAEKLGKYLHGVQVSLDGLEKGHDTLRGPGTFIKTLDGIRILQRYVPSVSIATMIHSNNISEFEGLSKLVEELSIEEWTLDLPSSKGNLKENLDLIPEMKKAVAIYKRYGYSSGLHIGTENYSCGSHLVSVNTLGEISKCGFFCPVGNILETSLIDLWKKVVDKFTPTLDTLECRNCEFLVECRGGCRFRAKANGNFLGKDPFICTLYEKYVE